MLVEDTSKREISQTPGMTLRKGENNYEVLIMKVEMCSQTSGVDSRRRTTPGSCSKTTLHCSPRSQDRSTKSTSPSCGNELRASPPTHRTTNQCLYFLPFTHHFSPFYLLPLTFYILLVTFYRLPVTCYLLPVTCYIVPRTWYLVPRTPFYLVTFLPFYFLP